LKNHGISPAQIMHIDLEGVPGKPISSQKSQQHTGLHIGEIRRIYRIPRPALGDCIRRRAMEF
jgi:hypothetical protein